MLTKTLTFRLPVGWPSLLDRLAYQYHFDTRAEMLGLIVADAAFSGRQVKGIISPPSVVVGCRLPLATYQAITSIALKGNSISTWAGLTVVKWVEDLQKEDNRQQKKNPIGYRFFIEDYAKHFRDRVAVYNINRGKYEG